MDVGDLAPDFELATDDGSMLRLSDELAHGPVVLFFYPRAMTSGCTAESCHFRDLAGEFAEVGARRLGISADSVDRQHKFRDAHAFDYPLLSDSDKTVAKQFGVSRALVPFSRRATFVIDTDRRVLAVIRSETKMEKHADDALAVLPRPGDTMSMETPEQRSIISGIGISRIGRHTQIPGLELTLESARAAIADAGLTVADIDGVATVGSTPADESARALGIESTFTEDFAGGGLLAPLMGAMLGVAAGAARHVLVYRTVEMAGGTGGGTMTRSLGSMGDMASLTEYHAYSAANWLAMHCRRHMHLYGTTKEQLGALAVNSRRNAGLNPLAVYRDPITLDDYLHARPISDPFGLLDCDVPIDGSVALVVSTIDHATACDHPVRVEAIGGTQAQGGWYQRGDYPKMSAVEAAAALWGRTDLTSADVDFAEIYDGFTFLTLSWLEALGFCADGEAGPFVAEPGRIELEGSFPVNTYGGQLSAGRMHGYWVVHEACLQVRGQAGERQVARHEVAAVASGGGPLCGALLLTF